ncbi:MAG: DUF4079 family protein [Candidatus Tectomicrobia bacterium]|nr:DUF4079 family protein [Candidatus Tectomicrobia bacterium]
MGNDFLAYVHPLWQGLILLTGFFTLSIGLKLRRHRLKQQINPSPYSLLRTHVRLGKIVTIFLSLGYLLGLVSMLYLREKELFRSPHAFFGTIAYGLFLIGAYYGYTMTKQVRRIEDLRDLHAFCVTWALYLALAVVIMGFILLP